VTARERFEELVRRHYRAVLTYARATTSVRIAEDAVQETFLRAWRYFDSFRGEGSFEGWLIRICRRCIIDLVEREQRSGATELTNLTKSHHTPQTAYVETMMLIETLDPHHREVVALCGMLGYDYESAARILDVPVGTVRSRLSRARALLVRELEDSAEGTA
jgi:RNA polymerase sigma-70 factor (ECF subfamily)